MKKITIIGGGVFGLYAAVELAKNNFYVDLIEQNKTLGQGATRVNQARLHKGYHYPRSKNTALQCIRNFDKFINRFPNAIFKDFDQYYAIAAEGSKTSSSDYKKFCEELSIPIKEKKLDNSFIDNSNIQANYLVQEYAFDWKSIIYQLKKEAEKQGVNIHLNSKVFKIDKQEDFTVSIKNNYSTHKIKSEYLVNATYSNLNGINKLVGAPAYPLEFELCEMVLIRVPKKYSRVGITIMDGNFTSVMPFGHSGLHSISNVRRTPHERSVDGLPKFKCNSQIDNNLCKEDNLNICLKCPFRPKSWSNEMIRFAERYIPWIKESEIIESMFAVKAIKKNVDSTDERPSELIINDGISNYYSLLSGKVDTVLELTEALINEIKG